MEKETVIKVAKKVSETSLNTLIGLAVLMVMSAITPSLPGLVGLGLAFVVAYLTGRGLTSALGTFEEEKSDEDLRS